MWSRYHILTGRVRVAEAGKRGVFVPIPPIALFAVRSAMLSCDGLLDLIPGGVGRKVRAGADALQKSLAVLLDEGFLVDVRVDGADTRVRVKVRLI
jgi:hypothetical protein